MHQSVEIPVSNQRKFWTLRCRTRPNNEWQRTTIEYGNVVTTPCLPGDQAKIAILGETPAATPRVRKTLLQNTTQVRQPSGIRTDGGHLA